MLSYVNALEFSVHSVSKFQRLRQISKATFQIFGNLTQLGFLANIRITLRIRRILETYFECYFIQF